MSGTGLFQKLKLAKRNWKLLPKLFADSVKRKCLLNYKLNDEESAWPQQVVWEITERCNLNCSFCAVNKMDEEGYWEEDIKNEMDYGECMSFIDEISEFKPKIHISGGEPFMKENFLDFVSYIKGNGMICTVVTNGTWDPEKIDGIIDSGLDVIHFSLDGPAEIHNKIRGKEIFEDVTNNIRKLVKERKDLPVVKINTTVSNWNYQELDRMVKIAENLGVDTLQFQHLWFTDKKHAEAHKRQLKKLFGMDSEGIDSFVTEIDMDIDYLVEKIQELKNRDSEVDIGFNPPLNSPEEIRKYYRDLDWAPVEKCAFPWYQADVKPNGDVSACLGQWTSRYVFGNLKEKSFEEIWNGVKAKEFRRKLKEVRMFAGCTRCCGLYTY